METVMQIRESAEMYLETILILSQKGKVRSIDIAKAMNFSRPSVSGAVHNLEKEGCISIENDGTISLLPKGKEIADKIFERHTIVSSILEKIGVSKDIAETDACKIEHIISEETFKCLKEYFGNK